MNKKFIYSLIVIIIIIIIGLIVFQPDQGGVLDVPSGDGVDLVGSGNYPVDSLQSKLVWASSFIIGNPHSGTVGISQGQLELEEGQFKSGQFEIDMTTITEDKNDEKFVGHMISDDFFAVEEFSTSKLVLTKVEKEEGVGKYMVFADLRIKDKTNSISFPANVVEIDEGIKIQSEFEIDRTLWDINFKSGSFFKDLGDKAIKDEIKFNLDLVLVK